VLLALGRVFVCDCVDCVAVYYDARITLSETDCDVWVCSGMESWRWKLLAACCFCLLLAACDCITSHGRWKRLSPDNRHQIVHIELESRRDGELEQCSAIAQICSLLATCDSSSSRYSCIFTTEPNCPNRTTVSAAHPPTSYLLPPTSYLRRRALRNASHTTLTSGSSAPNAFCAERACATCAGLVLPQRGVMFHLLSAEESAGE
jgi:hypothetical protein